MPPSVPDTLPHAQARLDLAKRVLQREESRECQAALDWFAFDHLPSHLAKVSASVAAESCIAFAGRGESSPNAGCRVPNEQLLQGLQFLLLAKDALVRAAIAHGDLYTDEFRL